MALASTITDSFNRNSLAAIWDPTTNSADGSQVTNVNNQLQISHTATSQYNACLSTSTYDLTSNSFFCRVTNVGNQALASHEAILALFIDLSNSTWFTCSGNTLSAYKKVLGVQLQVGSSITYSA